MHSHLSRSPVHVLKSSSWALALGLAVGCGASATPSLQVPGIERLASGPDLAVLPSEGEVTRVGLWIDAGARDAKLPAIATIAARLAAARGGEGVHAWTGPDATELWLPCPVSELASCVGKLARALGLRDAQPAAVAREQARLNRDRRTAIGADPARAADALALSALLGEDEARALLPLGDAADDEQIDAASVAAFMAAHFGPKRSLLIAAGPVTLDALRDAASKAFARARAATERRASRSLSIRGGVAVQVDDASRVSIALSARTSAEALAHAHALRRTLLRTGAARGAVGHAMPLRGGAIALLRVQHRGSTAAVVRESALYAAREQPTPVATNGSSSARDSAAATRQIGLRWAAEGDVSATHTVGVGVLRAGGRADEPELDDPDAPVRERVHERLEVVWLEAEDAGDTSEASLARDDEGSATLDNGAVLALRRRAGNALAIAVRFERGARHDPPTMHGRAALLATTLAHACQARRDASAATGITHVRPLVDADAWGLAVVAQPNAWRAASELALGCTLAPSWSAATLTTARLALRERVDDEALAPRALAAQLLGGGEPGALAPWGSKDGVGRTSREALSTLHAESLRSGVRVGIVGALPADAALGDALHRLRSLPRARAATSASEPRQPLGQAPGRELNVGDGVDVRTVSLGWSAAAMAGGASGAVAFAAAVRALLGYAPEVEVLWHEGGQLEDRVWAALGLRASEARLRELDAIVANALKSLDAKLLEHAVLTSHERAMQQHANRHGDLAPDAWRIAGGTDAPAAPTLAAAKQTARALAAAPWGARLVP